MPMTSPARAPRVAVIGAGVSGLTAARDLASAGAEVIVFDKGRTPGGRMATRRIAGARLDHGAQFFTVRSNAFAQQVEHWTSTGSARIWCHGFGASDGHPRYVGTEGMNALARTLASGLELRCEHLVFAVRPGTGGPRYMVVIDDGSTHEVDAVVSTCPLPQSASVLATAEVEIPTELWRTDYDRILALLAVLDAPSAVPDPGGVPAEELEETPFAFVADNATKGVSTRPAVTVHATAEWSAAHWDEDHEQVHRLLLAEAQRFFGGAAVVESQLKRWRFARPTRQWPEPCWSSPDGSVVLAGDAFRGPKADGPNLEAAFTSGAAAAEALIGSVFSPRRPPR